jgi:hypothetical protein
MDQYDPSVSGYFQFLRGIGKEEIPALPDFGPAEIERPFHHGSDRKGIRIAEEEFTVDLYLAGGEKLTVLG